MSNVSSPNRRVFKPRLLPRNKYDWRLILVLYPVVTFIALFFAFAWFFLPTLLVMRVSGSAAVGFAVLAFQWLSWMAFFLSPIVNKVEVEEEGIRTFGAFGQTAIAWDEIETAKVITVGEFLRESFRWPFRDASLRFSNSPLTFCQYIRIKHKRGTLYYATENTEELLTVLLARRSTATVAQPWYHAATVATRTEENNNPLRLRPGAR